METWKQSPQAPLVKKYIDCYWFIEKDLTDVSASHPKLNPDPAAHLILAPACQSYHYQFSGSEVSGNGCHLILPNTSSITLDHSKSFAMIGIKFHVGAIYSLIFGRDFPLKNFVVTDPDFLPPELSIFTASEFPLDVKSKPDNICEMLDEKLLPWVQRNKEDIHSELVRNILSVVDQTPIAEIGNVLKCSQRTIERAFRRVSGLTLKQYQSMVLLENLLTYLYQHNEEKINWADLAAQFGFSDQSHFIRNLKAAIGTTPKDYLKQRDVTIDVYGDFE